MIKQSLGQEHRKPNEKDTELGGKNRQKPPKPSEVHCRELGTRNKVRGELGILLIDSRASVM